MKRYGNLWESLISFENIIESFRKAAKGKGYRPCVLSFVQDLEHNLIELQNSLITKCYKPGDYTTFYIYEPKKRMISAAPFRDRIVHHCLINVVGPFFESTFIHQSYANQIGKGTHRAIRDVQAAMRLHNYVMHCDIKKYFPSIDHQILKKIIARRIKDPNVLWLINLIIASSNPQEQVLTYFPGDNLFTPFMRRKGLPIGNLTSQFFANVYLSSFDHFVKERLKCRFYARYVDDVVVVDSEKDQLWKIRAEMQDYLKTLRLRFHQHKSHVRPVKSGVRFLGQIIYPDRRLLPKSSIRRFMRRMWRFQRMYARGDISMEEIMHSLRSWLGHAKQANTKTLRGKLLRKVKF